MGFKCGIIGLPNVGKSSLFNALVGLQKAASENYPFCTIEPNIGKKYEDTRHNVGFKIIDHLVKANSLDKISISNKFRSVIFKGKILDNTVILCKPTTMMNCSGEAVRLVKEFYKINNENIFVFHDELDLVLPKVKFKYSGSSAGHNGIKSIDKNISNKYFSCLLYTSPSPRDGLLSRMPSSA